MIRNRNPGEPRQSNIPFKRSITSFNGMLTGEPASKIPGSFAALNDNVIDYGDYCKIRSGSRPYTTWRYGLEIISADTSNDIITLDGVQQLDTGDVVYFFGDSLPTPFHALTAYYVIDVATNKISIATSYANALSGTKINISSDGDGYVYYGEINAKEDHDSKEKLVVMMGKSVYVFDKAMTTITKVLNQHGTDPDGISTAQKYGDNVIIFSATGIFNIILDDFPRMHPVNLPVPDTLIDDINETIDLIYGYLYLYSFAVLGGIGNRSRFDSEILFESATNLVSGQFRDYAECYFSTEIGIDQTVLHSIGEMVLPDDILCATHFVLYRTRNIGENSGGVSSSIEGIGNRRDFIIYDADVPVAKAFMITVEATTATITGNNAVRGDVGCEIKDINGNTDTINTYISGTEVEVSGTITGSNIACAIGGGRVMKASQSNNTVTINDGIDSFAVTDVGLIIFISDGTYRYVKRYINSLQVEVLDSDDFIELAITIKPLTGNFSRKWNDTVPDDPCDGASYSLKDLYEYGSNIYIPRRQYKPLPNSDVGVIDSGFVVVATRNSSEYYYCQIGDKDYHIGYYRDSTQKKKVSGTIRHIVKFQFMAVILMRHQTGVLMLSSSINVGNAEVGEVVFELPEMSTIDSERGVNLWQTVVFKNRSVIFAVTDDGAYRSFDGVSWSEDNYAYINGKDAVSRYYLMKIDQSTRLVSLYSPYGGMKLWITRNLPNTESSDTVYEIVQCVVESESEEVWQCVVEPESEDVIQLIGVSHV
jgi:hypothetical protein